MSPNCNKTITLIPNQQMEIDLNIYIPKIEKSFLDIGIDYLYKKIIILKKKKILNLNTSKIFL